MSSLNKAMIIGRLTEQPNTRYTQSNTAVSNFSVATNERYTDKNGEKHETTEFHRVVAWGKLAEICQQYLTKGSLVYIEGPIQTRSWEDKDGVKKYTTEIKALSMQMLDSKGESKQNQTDSDALPPPEPANEPDDLPFIWLLIPFSGLASTLIQMI